MKRNRLQLFILSLSIPFLLSSCAPLLIGGAAVGAGTAGTYYYINGELKTDYSYSFDEVWEACERTIAEMKGIEVIPEKKLPGEQSVH